jgi:lipid II:glycine glycyltransferase (peptidoglycan interpeptide bridge formation enzyme)
LRLEVLDPKNSASWDEIVDRSPNGTLFHSWKWLKIAEEYSKSKLFPLVFFDDDNNDTPFGAIPLFYLTKSGMKFVFSPPPACSMVLGPVFIDKDYRQRKFLLTYVEFQASIDSFIQGLGAHYTRIVTHHGLLDTRPFIWAGYAVSPLYTYMIDLSQGKENIWNNLSSSLRRHIRKAEESGVTVINTADISALDYLYETLEKRYMESHTKLGTQKEYAYQLLQQFGDSVFQIPIAVHNGKTLAGHMSFNYKDTVTLWLGGSRDESDKWSANSFLLWKVILKAIDDGFRWIDMSGANTQHLCLFKSGYDPSLFLYFEIRKTNLLGKIAQKAYLLRKRTPF